VEWIRDRLQLDPEAACRQISSVLRDKLLALKRDGILVGLSGGLDSAVVAYLAVRSVGRKRVTLINLPERDSKPIHRRHAALVADALGIDLQVLDLTPILKATGSYDLLPLKYMPGRKARGWLVRLGEAVVLGRRKEEVLAARLRPEPHSLVAKASAYVNIKHRTRMALLYNYAEIANLMVVGAANRTEWLTGTFVQWGCDQCADVMPVLHLYRSQLERLAGYLGVPEPVRGKPADPDVMPGVDDKGKLLGSFEQADAILWGLEHRVDVVEMAATFGREEVERIQSLFGLSAHMREIPYGLQEGGRVPTRGVPTSASFFGMNS
jgi:NAD+ synthase